MKVHELNKLPLERGDLPSGGTRESCLGKSAVECTWSRSGCGRGGRVNSIHTEQTGHIFNSMERLPKEDQLLKLVIDTLPDRFFAVDADNYTIILANSVATVGPISKESKCFSYFYGNQKPCSQIRLLLSGRGSEETEAPYHSGASPTRAER